MKYIIIAAIIMALASCSSTKKTTGTAASATTTTGTTASTSTTAADGSSFEKAIVINAKSEGTGVDAEYAWLKKNYPGYKTKSQRLTNHDKKPYDIITIETADGATKEVYFDISKFFGKF